MKIQQDSYSQWIHYAAKMSQLTGGIASLSSEAPTLLLALQNMALSLEHKPTSTLLAYHGLSSDLSPHLKSRHQSSDM